MALECADVGDLRGGSVVLEIISGRMKSGDLAPQHISHVRFPASRALRVGGGQVLGLRLAPEVEGQLQQFTVLWKGGHFLVFQFTDDTFLSAKDPQKFPPGVRSLQNM